jgi:hypothetical protein
MGTGVAVKGKGWGVVALVLVLAVGLVTAQVAIGREAGKNAKTQPDPSVLTGKVNLTDQTWICNGPVNLKVVKVNITADAQGWAQRDGIHLDSGCTGTIGSIVVKTAVGDGVKVGGATNLVINGGTITCSAKGAILHQDGIQAMNGSNVTFNGITVNCPTGSNAGFFVKWGQQDGTEYPDSIIFNDGKIFPTQSSTASVTDWQTNSGVTNSVLCPSRYYTYRKGPNVDPIDIGNTYPASC